MIYEPLPGHIHRKDGPIHLTHPGHTNDNRVGDLIRYRDGSYELSIFAYPQPGATLTFEINDGQHQDHKKTELIAIIPGPLESIRAPIGQVCFNGNMATATFFALPTTEARFVFTPATAR